MIYRMVYLIMLFPLALFASHDNGCFEDSNCFDIAVKDFTWFDDSRDRQIPARIYYPLNKPDKSAVIIFSHGLGGSCKGYEYLGRYWAGCGFVSVHIQHKGSDEDVWKNQKQPYKQMQKAANYTNTKNRPLDVSFTIDSLEQLNISDEDIKGKLDLTKIGVAGHSFGSNTTMLISGQKVIILGFEKSFRDERVKAAIAMSSPVPDNKRLLKKIYADVNIPVFHMTGTNDNSPIGNTKAVDRRIPFDYSNDADTYLLILTNGDHMAFSGRQATGRDDSNDEIFHKLICTSSTAFGQAYLNDDQSAKKWLKDEECKKTCDSHASFETK